MKISFFCSKNCGFDRYIKTTETIYKGNMDIFMKTAVKIKT